MVTDKHYISYVRDRGPEHVRGFLRISAESFNSACVTGDKFGMGFFILAMVQGFRISRTRSEQIPN